MSNISYSLIDDDHIDDQETINVGNLIIDLESDLEKGSGQANNAQPTTSNSPPTSSSPLGSESNNNNNTNIMTAGSSTRDCGTSTSIGTITEPDCLGPCEPGTSVTLEGIVWQETDGGVLVVNVTWRGKTYVGALLDCTKHDWAPPRLCDSPASDIDSKAHRGVRLKRIFTRSGLDEKNLLQTTGKLRNGKGRRILPPNDGYCVQMNVDTTPPATKTEQISTNTKEIDNKAGPNSPVLIGCSEPNCSKKYRNMNGLLYHQAHAHSSDNDSSNAQDDTCSLLNKDKERETSVTESIPSTSASTITGTASMQEPRSSSSKPMEVERRTPPSGPPRNPPYQGRSPVINSNTSNNNASINSSSNNNNHTMNNNNNSNYPPPKSTSSSSKQQSNPPPEEGMKPSGTSTGPPPAPHQTNCYFNSAYLANAYGTSPYGIAPFIPRPPLPIYNQFTSPTFPPRFMNSMRVPPPPEPPAHLTSPSDQDVRLRCCAQLQRQQAARRG